ncbi:hypothetical protein C0J52_27618 [Blattella germanica]|nr:hypothetical protein C0J52_27618 [Blattella germanica]
MEREIESCVAVGRMGGFRSAVGRLRSGRVSQAVAEGRARRLGRSRLRGGPHSPGHRLQAPFPAVDCAASAPRPVRPSSSRATLLCWSAATTRSSALDVLTVCGLDDDDDNVSSWRQPAAGNIGTYFMPSLPRFMCVGVVGCTTVIRRSS